MNKRIFVNLAFEDIDGHLRELVYMDPNAKPNS